MIKWDEQWAQTFALALLFVGFVMSILLRDPFLSYLSVLLAGFVAGRIYYIKKISQPIFPVILIIIGFLLGYLAGNFWNSRLLTLLFFGLGFGVSYYLHLKKILVIFKSPDFLK